MYFCTMRIRLPLIFIIMFTSLITCPAQVTFDCASAERDEGMDIMIYDAHVFSSRSSHSNLLEESEIIFCPAGIERSSPDDVKKRWSFDWRAKYNNIYIRTSGGLVIEGINEHGFSASLLSLKNSLLPKKEKELIPIAASLAINFFIDHFSSIDTALLAVWDTRIFDDIGQECGWPFRLVLHDSAGKTAYVEHIDGNLRVFTPGVPAIVAGGPDYSRLVTIKHLGDSIPLSESEKRFLLFDKRMASEQQSFNDNKNELFMTNLSEPGLIYMIERNHSNPGLIIFREEEKKVFMITEKGFIPGREIPQKIF